MTNKNRKNLLAYNPEEMERLRRVALPAKLKCSMCLKNYNQANFSQKQLTDVRWQVSKIGRIGTNPKCFKCTGGQLVEIECVMCHKTKGLEGFARSQRKSSDDARCYSCTEVQVSRQPVSDKTYEDPNNAFFKTESSSGSYPDYFSSANTSRDTNSSTGDWGDTESADGGRRRHEGGGIELSQDFQRGLSISGEVSAPLIDSEFSHTPSNNTKPGPWSRAVGAGSGTGSWHTGTATASSANSGLEPTRRDTPEGPIASGSVHSFNSSVVERSQSGSDRVEMRNGFARIRAYQPEMREDPWANDEDEGEEKESSSDDEDYDDDDDTVI